MSAIAGAVLLPAVASTVRLPAPASAAPFVMVVTTLVSIVGLVSLAVFLSKAPSAASAVPPTPFKGDDETLTAWLSGAGLLEGDFCGPGAVAADGDWAADMFGGRAAGFWLGGAGEASGGDVGDGSLAPLIREANGLA